MRMIAVLGFRPHTGWAAAVAVADGFAVLDRRRIAYEPEPTRFIYHRAADMPLSEGMSLITLARAAAISAAEREIANMLNLLSRNGAKIKRAGVPGGNINLPDSLAKTLSSHSRIHAAEGSFYRDVLAEACTKLGLQVERVPERDLWATAAAALDLPEESVRANLIQTGKSIGPPWGEDQRLAALAAYCALGMRKP